ncbi:hypothetical protein PACTADRAFT_19036 [Pachysolen tannophilus NRRL Y-2460]|uniref:Myosin motor domain-containing protein n=1 Tax=Pachysolen tannophilus NRRL Y-2460 TaxID=669874 RepID=A0A1E4TN05_PACTA|nr:hypothetical protein PACTADRAFT_19036 [Pachysolen tannophilus NRRL Y-2460]
MSSTYEVGTRCWYPDEKEGWVGTEVTSHKHEGNKYIIGLVAEDGREFTVEADSLDENNKDLPQLRNPPILEANEDLTSLSYLNEPAVLNAIKIRYSQLNIYTYSGIVLIATNPFQRVDQLYSPDIIQAYAGKRRGELEPHLFAVAEDAYRCMKRDGKNQTIIVSGESGAGKTVSAKYIMRFFASVEADSTNHDMSDTEKQILATNPIMEAFGNAKTTRNDNSSRFGKYLEILFDKEPSIIGARVRTYLLERSRLVFQPQTERNYHIFYQIIKGMKDEDKEKLGLTKIEDFHYLNQGGVPEIEGVDDAKEFKDTSDALALIGIEADKQYEIYKILAALLHIGNIAVAKTRNDAHISSEDPNLVKACELLEIDPNDFSKWIVKKQIITRSEKIVSNLNHAQALVARDSVAKYIYSALFDWLVDYVNSDLCPSEVESKINSFIGVLDIYGFEHFDKNSFEQFCINYANEKLQQEFNAHVFKLEQEEYIKEEIEWSFIEFSDNQPCIDLIEQKVGILALLDEESRLPSGNDASWVEKMYQTLAKPPTNKVFSKPRFGNNKFTVSHYALDVTYDNEGFIEKNRDTVSDGHLETLKATSNQLLQEILATVDKSAELLQTAKQGRGINKKPTLGSIFKNSLVELMKTINSTNAHYIRCIKPNEQKKAWEFDPLMVLSQLRACGVLETIRISCAGFPSRWTYVEFADRYHILVSSDEWLKVASGETTQEEVSGLCNKILSISIDSEAKYQLGNTKIFFKAGMLAHLEKLRSDKLFRSAVLIQKNLRMLYHRRKYLEIRNSIMGIQSVIRGKLVRVRIQREIEEHAATMIQTAARGYLARTNFQLALHSIIILQSSIRGLKTRRETMERRNLNGALVIQRSCRSYLGKREFRKYIKATIFVQCCLRRKLAIKELKALKVEAKSVNKMKEVQYNLENKVIELTQSLTSKIQDNKNLVTEITKLKALLDESSNDKEILQQQHVEFNQKLNTTSEKHLEEVTQLTQELNSVKSEFGSSQARIEELLKEQEQLKDDVKRNVEALDKARADLEAYDAEKDSLNKTILQLKSDIISLQQQQPQAKVLSTPTRNQQVNNRHSLSPSSNQNLPWSSPIQSFTPRPVSVMQISRDDILTSNVNQINDELWKLLRDSRSLHKEIVDGLLKGIKIPPATVAGDLTRKEVLFPARIVIIVLSDMWRLGLTKESEDFLGEVLSVIQNLVSALKDEEVISHGAFWLSNTHELYSFVSYAQSTIIANDNISNEMSDSEYDEYLKLVAVVKEDFESLSYNIYNMWMKKMEKDLEKKAVSAVVLSQSLPGFMAPESSPFLSKVFSQGVQYKMDDILSFFNSVYWAMKSYFFEPEVMNEVIIELLRFVDALCFNDLIMRRNFLSWKRGLQLNYNVTRLEEWCKSHSINEGGNYLVHLLQAAKLLQLRKNTPDDIDIIYEICYALKPSQVQKLISQYYVADYETPIAPGVLAAVAKRVKEDDKEGGFFLDVTGGSGDGVFDDPFRNVDLRGFTKVEAYIPSFLNLPAIRRIVELVSRNAEFESSI